MQAEIRNSTKALGLAFSQAFTQALTEACEASWSASVSDEASAAQSEAEPATTFRFRFHGPVEGECFLSLRNVDVVKLALKGAPDSANGFGEEHAAALERALKECVALLPGMLPEFGAVTLELERARASDLAGQAALGLRMTSASVPTPLAIQMFLDAKLASSLEARSARPVSYPAAVADDTPANLDMVLDVALNVTLRFGQRQLSLREVLDLTSGSVVELDRQVDEPVELVLDGRVVARGEAVIIDGNYGMRITQVLQPIVA